MKQVSRKVSDGCIAGDDELEVEVLRIAVLRETWQCLAEDDSPSCVADPSQVLPEVRLNRLPHACHCMQVKTWASKWTKPVRRSVKTPQVRSLK